MVNTISYSLLRADEMYALGMQFVGILGKINIEDPQLTQLRTNVVNRLSVYDQAHLKSNTKLLTLKVNGADGRRDNSFRAFVTYVSACAKRLKPEWEAPCALLNGLIDLHGRTLYADSYTKQTSRMVKLFHDVENSPELKAAITIILADEWYAEMKTAATEFETVYDNRNASASAEPTVKTEDAFIDLRYAMQMLIKYVEVMESMNLNAVFATIAHEFNGMISPLMVQVRARKTRSEKEKEEIV